MSYRDVLSDDKGARDSRRQIGLDTHLGSTIDNETTDPVLRLGRRRLEVEKVFAGNWACLREPIAGYNCFGLVFACRRTGIFDTKLIEMILAEDGYSRLQAEDVRVGDVVLYYLDDEPFHAAVVVGLRQVIVDGGMAPRVLSKFDDVSGEYEHFVEDWRWSFQEPTWLYYRARQVDPRRARPSWRDVVLFSP